MGFKIKSIHDMTREELLEHLNLLERKVEIYSERDWLMTQVYIAEIKKVDEILLEMYAKDTIEKSA